MNAEVAALEATRIGVLRDLARAKAARNELGVQVEQLRRVVAIEQRRCAELIVHGALSRPSFTSEIVDRIGLPVGADGLLDIIEFTRLLDTLLAKRPELDGRDR